MSSVTENPQPKVTVDQDPAEWVNNNLSKAQSAPDATAATIPAEQPPAAQPNPLDLNLPEDFEHGFFRGKPVKELYKSFRATEAEMQRAQREAKELRDERERLRAETAAANLAVRMAAEQRQATPQDSLSEIEKIWFENPKEAARRLKEETIAEARRIATESQRTTSAETQAAITNRDRQARFEAAREEARQRLNVDPATWKKRVVAVLAEITDPESRYFGDGQTSGPLVTQNYIDAYRELYGEQTPQPTVTVAPAKPTAGNPPGAHKPASTVAPPPNAGLPTLSNEKRAALTMTAQRLGIDPEKYITRYTKEVGQANA